MSQQPPEGLPSWLRMGPGNRDETGQAEQNRIGPNTPRPIPEPTASFKEAPQPQSDRTSNSGESTDVSTSSTAGPASTPLNEATAPQPAQENVYPSPRPVDQPAATASGATDPASTTPVQGPPQPEVPRAEQATATPTPPPTVNPEPTTNAHNHSNTSTPMGDQAHTPSHAAEPVVDVPARDLIAADSLSSGATGRHHAPGGYDLTPPPALDQSNLVNPVKAAPRRGWRKMLYSMTGGHVNVGDSVKDLEHDALLEKIRRPMRGDYRIAIMSLKGGVGKTTTTVALGGVFATVRHDRVIAIDANPDLGTLAQRVAAPGPATIRDLLAATDVARYASVRQYTTQAESRLEVIGSERDPAISEAFSESDYRHAIDILQHHYNVILTDCGTGLMHSAMSGVLDLANTLVLVTSPALDGAQSASATLDWLNLHGYEQLAANAVVVVSAAHPGNATIDMNQLIDHFRSRTRAVHVIPFDRHLSEGAIIDLQRVNKDTYRAYMELAAIVAEDFDSWHRHASS